MKVTAVVPTKNEAKSVGDTLKRTAKYVDEIILIDGHSTDDTIAVAKKTIPSIKIVHQKSKGKGAGMRESIPYITGDIVVFVDADGSHIPEHIPTLVKKIEDGADMVIASRFLGGSDEFTPLRKFLNWLVNVSVNLLFNSHYSDTQNGFRALRVSTLKKMNLISENFEVETEMCIRASKLGAKVVDVPSHEMSRVYGASNLSILKHGPYHFWTVVREFLFRK